MSSRFKIFSLITFLLIATTLFFLIQFLQQQQTLKQRAAGNTYFASPGDNLRQKASSLQAGDTLILRDGNYNGHLVAVGVNGTQTAPILIKAEHDGKVFINGGGNDVVIHARNSSYVVFEGFSATNGARDVVGAFERSHHITFRRITAHQTGTGNTHVFRADPDTSDILFEDCAGWGQGRYIFSAYQAHNITFRRSFGYQPSTKEFSPAPRGTFNPYETDNVTIENVVGTGAIPFFTDNNYYVGAWQTGADDHPNDNTKYIGSIFYNNCEGVDLAPDVGKNTQFQDVFFDNPPNSDCPKYISSLYHNHGIGWGGQFAGTIKNATIINSEVGMRRWNGPGPLTISNSSFVNNGTAIKDPTGNHKYSNFFNNGSVGVGLVSTDKQINPGYNIAKYGRGAYLFAPPALKSLGENGQDIGANILYQSINGQLTNKPLWPWPMEDRIKAELGRSVTWESGGGLWKTLDGVYGGTVATNTPTPSPKPTPTITKVPTVTVIPTATKTPTPTIIATKTPTPTQKPTISPTVSPLSTRILANICLHGLGNCGDNVNPQGGNTNPLYKERVARIALIDQSGKTVLERAGNILYDDTKKLFAGTIDMGVVPEGLYTIQVRVDNYLSRKISGIITIAHGQTTGQIITLPFVSLTTGDSNNDNRIDIFDYNIILSCFGSKANTASCISKASADINDDGTVDGSDYNLFLREISVQRGE